MRIAADDVLLLAQQVVSLLRDHEAAKARELVRTAERGALRFDHSNRLSTIEGINEALAAIRSQRIALRRAVQVLPEPERTFATREVETLLEAMFAKEDTDLRARKRKLSKPG